MKHNKWLSVLLVFCLVLGCMSMTANAEGAAKKSSKNTATIQKSAKADEPAGDEMPDLGMPALWVYGVEVTSANAANVLGDGKVSFDFSTNTLTFTGKPVASLTSGLHSGAIIYAEYMDLTIKTVSGLSFSSNTATSGIKVVEGALTVNGNLTVSLSASSADACVYVDQGLTVNGNLDVEAYNCEDSFGVKSINGPVTVTGYAAALAKETGIYCGNGDVTVSGDSYFMIDSEATLGFCPSSCIYTANGGVDLKSFSLEMGVAAYAIYANGPVHIGSALELDNSGGLGGGEGILSLKGGIVIDGNAIITLRGGVCLDSREAAEGITIKGNAELKNTGNVDALKAEGGPISIEGYLKVNGYGHCVVIAKNDITVGGYAEIHANYYSINHTADERASAMKSTDGSIIVNGNLTCNSSDKCVYAKKDIQVDGDVLLSFARANDSMIVDYGMKAETGAITVAGKLEILGKATVSAFAGTDITAAQNVTITNIGETSAGMESGGTITFVSGKWDVSASAAAIRAAEGIVIPLGFGVTLPENGLVSELEDGFAVTDQDGAVAAHAVIESKAAYYLIGPDWTVNDIDLSEVFVINPENENEYMLSTTLAVGDEIKVVKVEGGSITAWYPDGEHTQYHVDEAHSGEKTIYFKPSYDDAWSEFGGFFYIAATQAPAGHKIIVTDYTKGAAQTNLDAEQLYSGEVTFTVSADMVCKVGLVNEDGTITALPCTTTDGIHNFTVNVGDADIELVLVVKGDLNLNGALQLADATMIKRVMNGTITLGDDTAALQFFAGDVNGRNGLELQDATIISRIMNGSYSVGW